MSQNTGLKFAIGIDKSQFDQKMQGIRQDLNQLMRDSQRSAQVQGELFTGLLRGAGAFFSIAKALDFARSVARVRGEFQQLEVAFSTMLGSQAKADALMSQIVETAARTPFDLQGVASGAKQLLAYGTASEKVNETLIRLGNISAGLSIPLSDMVYLYGTTQVQGRLFAQDVRQFMGRGIPLVQELAKSLGKSKEQITKMVSEGKIGFPEVEKVIEKMTNQGGQFYNLMQAQSKTITGQISNLGDAIDVMFNEIGKASQGLISGSIAGMSTLVENYQKVGKILAGLVATYGSYRVAVMVASLANSGLTASFVLQYRWLQICNIAQKALNATMLKNPYILVATAVVGVISAFWALKESTDQAQRAQERFNEYQKQSSKALKAHQDRVQSLTNTTTDQAESDVLRSQALEQLKAIYPSIFEKYDIETLKLTDIAKLKKQIAEIDTQRGQVKQVEDLQQIQTEIKELEKTIALMKAQKGTGGSADLARQTHINSIQKELQRKKEDWGKHFQKTKEDAVNAKIAEVAKMSTAELEAFSKELQRAGKELDVFNGKEVKVKHVLSGGKDFKLPEKHKIKHKITLEYGGFEFGADAKMLHDMNKAVQGRLKQEKSEKQTNYAQEVADTIKALAKAEKALADFQAQRHKMSATAFNKRLKELQEEVKAYEDRKKELDIKDKTKGVKKERFDQEGFDRESARRAKDAALEISQGKIDAMEQGSVRELAQINLHYERRQLSIQQREQEELERLVEAERKKAELKGAKFDASSVVLNPETKAVFQTLHQQNQEQRLQSERTLYQRVLEEFNTLEEQKTKITEAYAEKRAILEQNNQNGENDEKLKLLSERLSQELFQLERNAQQAGTVIGDVFSDMSTKTVAEMQAIVDKAEQWLSVMDDLSAADAQAMREQIERIKESIDKTTPALERMGKAINNIFKKGAKNSRGLGDDLDKLAQSFQESAEMVKLFTGALSGIAEYTDNDDLKGFADGLNDIVAVGEKTMQGAMTGAQFGGTAGAVVGGALGLISGVMDVLNKAEKEYQEAIKKITQAKVAEQREYNKLLFEQKMLMKEHRNIFGVDQLATAVGHLELFKEKTQEVQNILTKKESRGGGFFSGGLIRGLSGIQSFKKELTSLDSIKMKTGRTNHGWWTFRSNHDVYQSITSQYKDLITKEGELNLERAKSIVNNQQLAEGDKERLQQMITTQEQAHQAKKALEDYLQSTFGELGSGFMDAIIHSLKTGEDAFETFGKSVGKVMEKIIKQMVFNAVIKKDLERLQKEANQAMDNSENDPQKAGKNLITVLKSAQEILGAKFGQAKEILETLDKEYNFLEGDQRGEAKKKGFGAMTQDSADQLNGQFRHLTELNRRHLEVSTQILATAKGFGQGVKDLQNFTGQSLLHLSKIEQNTFVLHRMQNDISAVKLGMETINTKGIKMLV